MENNLFNIILPGKAGALWTYVEKESQWAHDIGAPVFEIDGKIVHANVHEVEPVGRPRLLPNLVGEYVWEGPLATDDDLTLRMVFRIAESCPVVRFRYELRSRKGRTLTKAAGHDHLAYLSLALNEVVAAKEIRFSEFRETVHSFCLSEVPLRPEEFENEHAVMGPMLLAETTEQALLVAYEHGSQAPDAFLQFALHADGLVDLEAVKGNYWPGRAVTEKEPFETIWFQFAATGEGEDALARAYREFVLRHLTQNAESRKPYIFYNTWAWQERSRWWHGTKFLDPMREDRILAEIDVAHRMGIDVFVLDTGWYEKTGDWRVNRSRFPDGLKAVREKLQGYGMKLGLWFNPLVAATSSEMLARHRDCLMTWPGRACEPQPVWETEESYWLCLVSRYWEAFAEELIRLVKEVGVTYFKWDAIGQYGCADAGHGHGGPETTSEERADSYAFEIGRQMIRVVDRLCRACPEAIVDFDITEGGRFVGLGFLAAGKYFLINNGPYYPNYDIPWSDEKGWSNIFVHPGPARGWICREPLTFDKWIPSVLFLTHYLPDDPADSQLINVASLILGQNGIWGDLLSISPEGVERFGRVLRLYKQVRDDITAAYPARTGAVGGSPEIHEKILDATGRGALVAFASAPGTYRYVTTKRVAAKFQATPGAKVEIDGAGRADVEFVFEKPGAKIVFFGVKPV